MKKNAWTKFFNSGSFHRRGSWGTMEEIKREKEDFQEPQTTKGIVVTTQLKKCDKDIGAGKRLSCNRYD